MRDLPRFTHALPSLLAILTLAPASAAVAERQVLPLPAGLAVVLPAPDLSRILFESECDASGATLQVQPLAAPEATPRTPMETTAGTTISRKERLSGHVQALAWLDARRYLMIRSLGRSTLLEAQDLKETSPQALDALPELSLAAGTEPGQCGLNPRHFSIHVGPLASDEGARIVGVTVRLDDASFEVRRYVLTSEDGGLRLTGKTTVRLGPELGPAGHRLLQVVPDLSSGAIVAVWQNRAGTVPVIQLDLIRPQPGPLPGAPWVRTLAHGNEELSSCVFAKDDRLLCQARSGDERGWLFLVDTASAAPHLRQLTHAGGAVAYALSPDRGSVAYIGSGGPDGPVVVKDLQSGAQLQSVLEQDTGACGSAATQAQIFWPVADQLLARGYCAPTLHLIARPEAEAAPAPEVPKKAAAGGAHGGKRRGGKSAEAFWRPRY